METGSENRRSVGQNLAEKRNTPEESVEEERHTLSSPSVVLILLFPSFLRRTVHKSSSVLSRTQGSHVEKFSEDRKCMEGEKRAKKNG